MTRAAAKKKLAALLKWVMERERRLFDVTHGPRVKPMSKQAIRKMEQGLKKLKQENEMTVGQLRRILKGQKSETPVVLIDNYHIDLLGIAEAGVDQQGRVHALRIFPSKQVSRIHEGSERLRWSTVE